MYITRERGDIAALLYERGTGTFAWSRLSSGNGKIICAAVLPGADGNDDLYLLVERNGNSFLEVLQEAGDVYLDSWRKFLGVENDQYMTGGVIYDRLRGTVVPASSAPDYNVGDDMVFGFPYASVMRTMPVLTNDRMKQQRITGLAFRFLNSYLPKITSIAGGRAIQTDQITNVPRLPYSGVWKMPFPGTWDEDVQAELAHDEPTPVTLLALNAEVQ